VGLRRGQFGQILRSATAEAATPATPATRPGRRRKS